MYILYSENVRELADKSRLFTESMEPLLRQLEAANRDGKIPPDFTQIPEYLFVCRLPFRRLEYSFALDALSTLGSGSTLLDAGSGVTPLAHIFALRGVKTYACDANARVIGNLQKLDWGQIYGETRNPVSYSVQDLVALDYPDAMFDAITCISVLEHIPAPGDQRALRELVRVLKPNGILVLTVDYHPPDPNPRSNPFHAYWKRATTLARRGNLREIQAGAVRKVQAQMAVQRGEARHPRSANQCFDRAHLEHDLLPLLGGSDVPSRIPYKQDWNALTTRDAGHFWHLENGKTTSPDTRDVLPAAIIWRKP